MTAATRTATASAAQQADGSQPSPIAEESPRDQFLASLRSKGKYPYRRYSGLPLRYGGGKSLAVGHVIEQLPAGLTQAGVALRGRRIG